MVGRRKIPAIKMDQRPDKSLICYCYEYSAEDIRQDVIANGCSLIMAKIKSAKHFGNCQCAIKNPKGR